ncbi:MAG: hypothetical protein ACTS27_01130, partial [Phycisphaerales bacterium]
MKGQINWFAPELWIVAIVLAASSSMLCKASPPATDANAGAATARGVSPAIKEQADRLRHIIWNNTLHGRARQIQAVLPLGPSEELWEASRAEVPDAMWLLGSWLRLDEDTRDVGIDSLKFAAANGHRSSIHSLCIAYMWGVDVEKDVPFGQKLCLSLISKQDPFAAFIMASEEYGRVDLAENAEALAEAFQLAADGGVGRAHAMLGRISAQGLGPTPGASAARAHYERGVAAGDVAAKGLLAAELWN